MTSDVVVVVALLLLLVLLLLFCCLPLLEKVHRSPKSGDEDPGGRSLPPQAFRLLIGDKPASAKADHSELIVFK